MTLNELNIGDKAKVVGFREGSIEYRKKLLDMGLTTGTEFVLIRRAPLGNTIVIQVRGYELTLRTDEANILEIEKVVT